MVPAKYRSIFAAVAVLLATRFASAGDQKPAALPPKLPQIEDFAPAEEFIQVGEVKTHIIRRGEKGRPIVLVHGFGSSTYTWRSNLGPLAKKHRVVAIDVKGFGLTAKPKDGQYHAEAYTRHLLEALDALKLDRPILVGSSMGGAIVARLALLHPDRVAGIILVDPAPLEFGPPRLRPEKAADASKGVATDGGQKLKFLAALTRSLVNRASVESGLKSAYHDKSLVTPELIEATFLPLTIEGAPEALIAMTSPPRSDGGPLPPLEGLKLPALLVWGKHDRIIPARVFDEYARRLPKAERALFDRSGHLPHEEEPDRFNRLVEDFASTIP